MHPSISYPAVSTPTLYTTGGVVLPVQHQGSWAWRVCIVAGAVVRCVADATCEGRRPRRPPMRPGSERRRPTRLDASGNWRTVR